MESPHSKAVDDDIDGCAGEIQWSDETKRVSSLFRVPLDPFIRWTCTSGAPCCTFDTGTNTHTAIDEES